MSERILVFEIYRGDTPVRVERVERDIVKIGSLPTSHLLLDDPAVSGIHGVIEVANGVINCIDLGSASGTRVNGTRINKCELQDGDVLEFGELRIVFHAEIPVAPILAGDPSLAPQVKKVRSLSGYAASKGKSYNLDKPSENKHYAQRHMSQPDETDGTIKVAHLWKDDVQSELSMTSRDKQVTVGSDSSCDIVFEDERIPEAKYAIVTRGKDGVPLLHLTQEMQGEVFLGTAKLSVPEALRRASGGALKVTPKTRARLRFGDNSLYIHQGTRPSITVPFGMISLVTLVPIIFSAAFHGGVIGFVVLTPPEAGSLDLDDFSLADDIVAISQMDEEPEPEELPEILQQQTEDEEIAAREQGAEGRAGVENETAENRRMAVEGPEDNEEVTLPQRDAQEAARERSALAVLNEYAGPSSMFGTVASGYDDVSAAGAVYGDVIGSARGFGGLGLSGGGFSGGGNNPGGFGVGRISTRGLYTGDEDAGADVSRGLRGREEAEIEVDLGRPEIEGHLDREIIQRVIREHRREIRDCYQREFQRNPELGGRIVVSFTIDPSGAVARADVSETEMNSSEVEDCITGRFMRFRFPAPTTPGLVHVNYPFVFTSGGGGG